MTLLKEITVLFKKELLLEWRQRYAFNGVLLYVGCTVFVCYLSFNLKQNQLQSITWNALFWIILLFTSVNAIAKSFMHERQARNIYYYTLSSPQGIILSKIFYNSFLMLLLSLLGFVFYSLVMGNPVEDKILFLGNILIGAIGFSTTLTLISGIASKAGNNSTLMAVLSFPIILPMLVLLIKVSKNAMDGLDRSVSMDEILILGAINMMVAALSYLLFPYLWKS